MTRETSHPTRRQLLKAASATGLGLSLAAASPWLGAAVSGTRSSNETLRVAIMGVNGFGARLARVFAAAPYAQVGWVCDVDQTVIGPVIDQVRELQGSAPSAETDFRRILEDPSLDALVIATPNHWHMPASLMALQAGKHVYVEKPASHSAYEAKLLAEAQARYRGLVQMGNQQRSHPPSIEAVERLRDGLIGRVYQARAWYANTRGSIGQGQPASPPDKLDYDLWQGPAPRQPYQDNVIHYNWHWFRQWGNGEIGNNGVHEIDIARWALGVDFPSRVTSTGGRYHFDDDWAFTDTQDAGFSFGADKSLVWHGRSCNGFPRGERSRGVSIHGTDGTLVMDRAGYEVYDLDNQRVEQQIPPAPEGPLDDNTGRHVRNFIAAIRTGEALNSPIADTHKSALLAHLGNIAQQSSGAVDTDPNSGEIQDNSAARALWKRTYAQGWEPSLDEYRATSDA